MPHERFFIDQPLRASSEVVLEEVEFHHLAHVMRMKPGETIELVNGKHQLATGRIQAILKAKAIIEVSELFESKPKGSKLILAQGIPRTNRLEFILEKGTELGVSEFWLFPARQGEKMGISENQSKRMTLITIAAMKQCGRLDLPSIFVKGPLPEWKPMPGTSFFGDVSPDAPPLWKERAQGDLYLFIGPEKGFDPVESAYLKDTLKAKGVSLHPNILRTDTAALTALSLIQAVI